MPDVQDEWTCFLTQGFHELAFFNGIKKNKGENQ